MIEPDARTQGIGPAMAEHCLSEARQLGFGRCSLISLSQPTNLPFIFGEISVLKLLALWRAHSVIPKSHMSVFTSCFARFCSRTLASGTERALRF
jgi:GNAT superfamily N-acetyltransferase